MKTIILISFILGAFLLGGLTVQAGEFYNRGDGDYTYITSVPFPDHIVTWLRTLPEILAVNEYANGHEVIIDAELFPNSQAAISYLQAIEYQAIDNAQRSVVIPLAQAMPGCKWDYGTSQKIGTYWFNGEVIVIQNDPKC